MSAVGTGQEHFTAVCPSLHKVSGYNGPAAELLGDNQSDAVSEWRKWGRAYGNMQKATRTRAVYNDHSVLASRIQSALDKTAQGDSTSHTGPVMIDEAAPYFTQHHSQDGCTVAV